MEPVSAIISGVGNIVQGIGTSISAGLQFLGLKRQIQGQKDLQQAQFEQERYLTQFTLANQNRGILNNMFSTDYTLLYVLIAVVIIIIIIIARGKK